MAHAHGIQPKVQGQLPVGRRHNDRPGQADVVRTEASQRVGEANHLNNPSEAVPEDRLPQVAQKTQTRLSAHIPNTFQPGA